MSLNYRQIRIVNPFQNFKFEARDNFEWIESSNIANKNVLVYESSSFTCALNRAVFN